MSLQHRIFMRAKGAAGLDRCEDASAAAPYAGRFAVADGATESAFTATWARLLVERFATSDDPELVPWDPAWLGGVRASWRSQVQQQLARDFGENDVPWYADEGLRRGAYATFVGLVVTPHEEGYRWRATAVGDTCLFHTRENELIEWLPIGSSPEFDNTPQLLASSAPGEEREGAISEGTAQANYRLWSAWDALAEWCLKENEAQRNPWRKLGWLLSKAGTGERFGLLVERLRSKHRLRNDDVTLLIVNL
jgi:hypothetical protein